jgi:signal transduction histidine kinase
MKPENASRSVSSTSAADHRMADLATFANGIAHDIRTPLSVIRTNVYLLKQQAQEDSKAQRALKRIEEQVSAALHLLDGIQAFQRATQPSLQRVNLNEVVRRVAESSAVSEGSELKLELEENMPTITADPQLLDAALRGLIRNSVEAMLGGGVIRLLTCHERGQVSVVVEDTGSGIPEEALSRVFDPFFSTRRAQAGLGLTLVETVARVHGGKASLHSTPGKGTRVVLELPVEG